MAVVAASALKVTLSPRPFADPDAAARNPFCRGICCDVDPDELSAAESDDDKSIEQVETDRRDDEQVHSGNYLARGYARRSATPGWAALAV